MKFYPVDGVALREAAKLADNVRAALQQSINAEEVAHRFAIAFPPGSELTPIQARTWAVFNVETHMDAVEKVLLDVWGTGGMIGETAALQDIQTAKRMFKAPTVSSFWANWEPGNHPAEFLVRPEGGLKNLLARKGVTIRGLSDTSVQRVGTALADAFKAGEGEYAVAERIREVLTDPSRALAIAHTEMNRALNAQKIDTYKAQGLSKVEWLVTEPCDICAENDGVSVVIGEEFPSGDTEPPVHTNCNCQVLPDVSEFDPGIDDEEAFGDKSATAKAGVPGPLEVERALSRLAVLPNPIEVNLSDDKLAKLVESPWEIRTVPTVDPNVWDTAQVDTVDLADLYGTDRFLKRKKVAHHIESMGQALTPFRSYALVLEHDNELLIIDGHHRLMASWLLGLDKVPVWIVKE